MGALLGSGVDSREGSGFVAAALSEMVKLRLRVARLVDLYNDEGLTRAVLTTLLNRAWDDANTEVNKIFGLTGEQLEREVHPRRAVAAFDELVDALSSEEAFVQSTAEDGGGVLDFAERSAENAAEEFARVQWEATATFGALGDTRFGAAFRQQRAHAKEGDPAPGKDKLQAFAYSTIEATRRPSDVVATGSAHYAGTTHAVDKDRNLYVGDIDLEVRFTTNRVNGLVTNLETEDGDRWSSGLGGGVERLFLPQANLTTTANWSVTGTARLSYQATPSSAGDQAIGGVNFAGRLLGRGEASGEQAVGTWRVGTEIAGAFGARRGADPPDPAQAVKEDYGTVGTGLVRGGNGPTADSYQVFKKEDNELEIKTNPDATTPNFNTIAGEPAQQFDIKLAELFGDGFPVESTDKQSLGASHEIRQTTHVEEALGKIKERRNQLRLLVGFTDADSSEADIAATDSSKQRLMVEIAKVIDEELFGQQGFGPVPLGYVVPPPSSDPPRPPRAAKGGPANFGMQILLGGDVEVIAETDTSHPDYAKNGQAAYPTRGGRTVDEGLLRTIDDVVAALEDRETFEEAFEEGGVFDVKLKTVRWDYHGPTDTTTTVLVNVNLAPVSAMFDKARSRLLMRTGSTDFTRFGAWTFGHSRSAADRGDGPDYGFYDHTFTKQDVTAVLDAGPAVFVYSPLEATSNLPAGAGRATYTGGTVAVQQNSLIEGGVTAAVSWKAPGARTGTPVVAGTLSVRFTDLRATDIDFGRGERLQHGGHFRGRGYAVLDMAFNNVDVLDDGSFSVRTHDLAITYDTIDGELPAAFQTGGQTVAQRTVAGHLDGQFVGEHADGPPGIIGTWEIPINHPNRGSAPPLDRRQELTVRRYLSTYSLRGAFGADFASAP